MPPDPATSGAGGTKKRKEPPRDKPPAAGKDGPGGGAGRFHKRAKVYDARNLRTQPADAALSNGELDLQAFLSAREFEIKALTDGMRRSKAVNNRRAFQLVPRGMRRRTASHNPKKLPKRLRARASREKLDDNTPTVEARRRNPKTSRARIRLDVARRLAVLAEKKRKRRLRAAKEGLGEDVTGGEGTAGQGKEVSAAMRQLIDTKPLRPKIRRNLLNNPLKPKAKFRKRQIDKTWLPTHLWHAKRAKMTPPKEPLWRFAIPLTPNEKVYRPTHRASTVKGAIVWDMSYMSTIGIYGHGAGIERTLRALGMSHDSLWDARGKRWRDGQRTWSGVLSKEKGGDMRRQIGPATVIWNPQEITSQPSEDATISTAKAQRQVYVRIHPSCFLEVFDLLVKLIRRETPRLYVEDLRFEIGSIELTGPGATEALLGIIRPHHAKGAAREPHAELFQSLSNINATAALPPDTVLGFSAQDPRLSYPPRTFQAGAAITKPATEAGKSTDTSPSPFLLFDRTARYEASRFPSQKALNRRKGKSAPGEPLHLTEDDPPFPIILFSSRAKSTAQTTWTLLTPWKCVLPIWYSLVHYPLSTGGNPRVGGMDELRQVTFEQGLPWFPGDFPGTDAGAEWELEQRQKRKALWERRPKSKRVEWTSLDLGAGRKGEIGVGWACEFERLFGLEQEPIPTPQEGSTDKSTNKTTAGTKSSQLHTERNMDVDGNEEGGAPVRQPRVDGNKVELAKQAPQAPTPHPLTLVRHLSKPSFNKLAASKTAEIPPTHSLVTIKIFLPGRGVVSPCARIYRLPPRQKALAVLSSTQPEFPATCPPVRTLPSDLRDQWLARLPGSAAQEQEQQSSSRATSQAIRFPPGADHDAKKLLLAQTLLTKKLPFPPQKNNADHPLVPADEDLIGYVTKGEFNLAEGRGVAIGSVSVKRALEAVRTGKGKEGYTCVVRNAGETIGWIGKWEVV